VTRQNLRLFWRRSLQQEQDDE